jgi:hypothetical protein
VSALIPTTTELHLEFQVALPLCAVCGTPVDEGEIRRSNTHNRYLLIVRCHGAEESTWIDEKERLLANGKIALLPAFGTKELKP